MSKQKKRTIISIIIVITAIVMCIIYAAAIISKDEETGNMIIKHNLFSDYTYEIYDDHVKLLFFKNQFKRTVTIPDTIMGKPVTEIGEYCFSKTYNKNTKLETVRLGKNVDIIGENAFMECKSLKEVLGNTDVSEVKELAFASCENLYKVEFKMSRVDDLAFTLCTSLSEINKDSEMTYIGIKAFNDCSKLTNIGKLDKLEYVDDCALDSTGIDKFEVNENTKFGTNALKHTPLIENATQLCMNGLLMKYSYDGTKPYIKIPEDVISLDYYCIKGDLSNLKEIYISDSVTEIRGIVCEDRDTKVIMYIPNSVTSIGQDFGEGRHDGIEKEAEKIVTTEGSYAQEYAKKYNIPCEIVDHIEMPEE